MRERVEMVTEALFQLCATSCGEELAATSGLVGQSRPASDCPMHRLPSNWIAISAAAGLVRVGRCGWAMLC